MKKVRFLSVHEMLSLDPNTRLADSSSATPLLKIVCPNLVRLTPAMEIAPELAASWTVSADQRVFTFELRPGLRFHNGSALDAEAVCWNFRRIIDSRTGSILGSDLAGLEKVRAVSQSVVQFAFADPFPSFLHHLAGRCHLSADSQMQPVGAGAFQLTDWVRGSHLTLHRFADYWDASRPKVDEIEVRWAPDSATRIAMIERGEVDYVEAAPAKAAQSLVERGLLKTASSPSAKKLSLVFNCAAPPFDDLRARQAIAHLIDRDALVESFIAPHGYRVDGAFPSSSDWATPLAPRETSIETSRALLADAGLAQGVNVRSIGTNVAPVPGVAASVGARLAEVGIGMDHRGYDDPPWWPLIYLDTDWQLAFQGMGPRAHPDILFRREFMTGGSFNPAGYSNPNLDAMLVKARMSSDASEQRSLYAEAQRILHDDLPVLILYAADTLVGWRPGMKPMTPHPLGYWPLDELDVGD